MYHANPFALLVSPEQVCHAVAHSERLARLRRRVYRPLDRPLLPTRAQPGAAARPGHEVRP